MSETCQRCGEEGEDRRTLWHACFYAMDELGLPFDRPVLFKADVESLTAERPPAEVEIGGQKIPLASGTFRSSGELTPHCFFTLRVCKSCRADWLRAIRDWFNAGGHDRENDPPEDGGVYVRKLGETRLATSEEIEALRRR